MAQKEVLKLGKDSMGIVAPFFLGCQASIASSGSVEMLFMPDLNPDQILVAEAMDKILVRNHVPTVVSGKTSEGLYCSCSRVLPTVIEARQTVDEEYLLRWPEETLGATPSRLIVENFYGGSYLVFCFSEGTVELFDRCLPVFKGGRMQQPKDKMLISELPWPEPFDNDLNLRIIRLVQDCYRALDGAMTKSGAKFEYLSLRLGYMHDRLAVTQLVEMRAKHGEEAISLQSPEKLVKMLNPPGSA